MTDRTSILPAHVEGVVHAIEELHERHDHRTTAIQRIINRLTAWVGRPAFIGFFTAVLLVWTAANLVATALGARAWDPPPFAWLELVVSVGALYTTVLILATQRHDDQLAIQRERLALELAILAEQKSAKIIMLLEEMRRDSPYLVDRFDAEAHAMSIPAEPSSVLKAHEEALVPEA